MTAKNGISSSTCERIVMGPGAVYIGTAGTQLLGATKGGNVMEINRTFRDIRPDGAKGKVKGFRYIESVEATLTVRLIEVTPQNLVYALAGSSLSNKVITGGEIASATYIDKIQIVAEVKGITANTEYNAVAVAITNALAEGPLTINLPEGGNTEIELKFHAHFDPAALTTEPWSITWTHVTS